MTAMEVLTASDLFSSGNDLRTVVKQRGARINGQVVDSIDEEIEIGDFLNFVWLFPGAATMVQKHGPVFLMVSRGKKQKTILKVAADGTFSDGAVDFVVE